MAGKWGNSEVLAEIRPFGDGKGVGISGLLEKSEHGGSFITGWTADPEEARTFIASLASIVAEAVGGKVISVEVDS